MTEGRADMNRNRGKRLQVHTLDQLKKIEGAEIRHVRETGQILLQHPDTGQHFRLDISPEAFENGFVVLLERE